MASLPGSVGKCLVLTGGSASVGPYGIDQLEELGVGLLEVPVASSRLHKKIADVAHHRTGVPMDKAVRSAAKVPRADVVLAFLESQAQAPSWAKAHGIPPYAGTPLTMMACWLAEELRTMPQPERRAVVRRYRGVDLTLVWSSNQIDILVDCGFDAERVESIPFGFAPGLFPPRSPRRAGPLVAVGFDRGRDYPTLITALRGSGLRLDLYSKPGNLEDAGLPEEVDFHGTVPFDEYRQVISAASIVAVPTKVMAYPTGQTVALEAAGSGACVVITDTPAIREYFSEETAVLVTAGDTDAWTRELVGLMADSVRREAIAAAGCAHVHAHFTYRQMWQRVLELWQTRGWV